MVYVKMVNDRGKFSQLSLETKRILGTSLHDIHEIERSRYVTLPWKQNFWMTTNRKRHCLKLLSIMPRVKPSSYNLRRETCFKPKINTMRFKNYFNLSIV